VWQMISSFVHKRFLCELKRNVGGQEKTCLIFNSFGKQVDGGEAFKSNH